MPEIKPETGQTIVYTITSLRQLNSVEKKHRYSIDDDVLPYARKTPYKELAEKVIEDRKGEWVTPLYLYKSLHSTTIGVKALGRKTKEFLDRKKETEDFDILSISTGMENDRLGVTVLLRGYGGRVYMQDLYDFLGESRNSSVNEITSNTLRFPRSAKRELTEDDIRVHSELVKAQKEAYLLADSSQPFLNRIEKYTPLSLSEIDDTKEAIYQVYTKDMQLHLHAAFSDFMQVFNGCMNYITTTEKDAYYNVLRGQMEKTVFYDIIESFIKRTYIETHIFPMEDMTALLGKIDRALFDLYIIQDLIDDPLITDIKITDPFSIRARVRGKAYLTNLKFIDTADYFRFIDGLAMMNGIDLRLPVQTFTDEQDDQFILRFSITAPYITSSGFPLLHVRKLPKKKMMSQDLIRAGMFDEKVRDYLVDCGRHSRGVVFAGPPGCGKTTCLNWFIEDAYESTAEILIIQENDELFANRKGVMIEHVVLNPQRGEDPCDLEKLGQMALVAGANVFVIGEAKGAEICSAITLSNSGCRTAITIHSKSSTDTIDKMVDLALRGSHNTTYEQAKRMIKSFQTIVYMQDFKVQEISEIIGYDEKKQDMIYRPIYRREADEA